MNWYGFGNASLPMTISRKEKVVTRLCKWICLFHTNSGLMLGQRRRRWTNTNQQPLKCKIPNRNTPPPPPTHTHQNKREQRPLSTTTHSPTPASCDKNTQNAHLGLHPPSAIWKESPRGFRDMLCKCYCCSVRLQASLAQICRLKRSLGLTPKRHIGYYSRGDVSVCNMKWIPKGVSKIVSH